jgi:hypothetical protein
MAGKRRRVRRWRKCQNATWEELLRRVEESIPPESWSVTKDILKQIGEYKQRQPLEVANGKTEQFIHGFVYWLWALQAGSSSLPEKIPHELLLAWRNGHANHPADRTPLPLRRCEDCLLVMPNCTPDGFGSCLTPCPVCGSGNISHKKLSGPPWDAMYIYTALPCQQRGANASR